MIRGFLEWEIVFLGSNSWANYPDTVQAWSGALHLAVASKREFNYTETSTHTQHKVMMMQGPKTPKHVLCWQHKKFITDRERWYLSRNSGHLNELRASLWFNKINKCHGVMPGCYKSWKLTPPLKGRRRCCFLRAIKSPEWRRKWFFAQVRRETWNFISNYSSPCLDFDLLWEWCLAYHQEQSFLWSSTIEMTNRSRFTVG